MESESGQRSNPTEKGLLTIGLLIYCFAGYYAIGLNQDPSEATSLRSVFDDAIPFVPIFAWGYMVVYTSLFIPVFTVKSPHLFRRVACAYFVVVSASLLTWLVFPVTAVGLRADLAGLGTNSFHTWGVHLIYALDPPMNLFPSLHAAIAVIATLGAWTAHRAHGLFAAIPAALILFSTGLIKQHFVADIVAGVMLACATYWVVLRPHAAITSDQIDFYTWRGPAAYALLHCAVVGALYVAYRVGWQPWG